MSDRGIDPRAERLKAALRENLRRRKLQVRGRAEPEARETPCEGPARPDERDAPPSEVG